MVRKVRALRSPLAGINQRVAFTTAGEKQDEYETPFCLNVRPEDSATLRRRVATRPGLTKFHDADFGDIAAMVPVTLTSGTALAIVFDQSFGLLDGSSVTLSTSLTATLPELATETGAFIVTENGAPILVSSATPPTECFLCAADLMVWAITATGVTKIDPATGIVDTLVASTGTVPTGCTFGCVYRDRLFLAGGGNIIYASRQGDFTDWNYGAVAEDTRRAFLFQLSQAGEVGGTPTALIPHKDQVLLAATATSLWVINGDPAGSDSTLRSVHRQVGIVGPNAWCKRQDTVFFLARNDLYAVDAAGGNLQNLSGDRVPLQLRDLDVLDSNVSLLYDHDASLIHLYLTPALSQETRWVFDLNEKGGFWADALADGMDPVAVCEIDGQLILAGEDGYLRTVVGDDDDGEDIQSHLLIGPILLADPTSYGRLINLQAMLGDDSGTVAWNLVLGDTPEEAVTNAQAAVEDWRDGDTAAALAYVVASGTFAAGRSHLNYPHIRSVWVVIWLQASSPWSYESLLIETAPSGRWR